MLSLEDVIGTKVRAPADRGLARDLIDVRTATDRWSHADLKEFGRRHARDTFGPTGLQARPAGADWIGGTGFAAYGLGSAPVRGCRRRR